MPRIRFVNESLEVDAPTGADLRRVAMENGIELHRGLWTTYHKLCGGRGLCGGCELWVRGDAPGATGPRTFWEKLRWSFTGTHRLACQAKVVGDCEVRTAPGGPDPERTVEAYREAQARKGTPAATAPSPPPPQDAAEAAS